MTLLRLKEADMRLMIANMTINTIEARTANHVPQIGFKICAQIKPLPIVKDVISWPTKEMLKEMGVKEWNQNIDAVVFVE